MSMSTQELPGGKAPDMGVEFPALKSVEELDRHVEATYGPEVLKALKDSTMDQAGVLKSLHEQGLNGRAERVAELYRVHEQEFSRKQETLSLWETTKEVVSAPFRAAYYAITEYPITTAVAATALALGGTAAYLYYAGQLEAALANVGLESLTGYFTQTVAQNAPLTPSTPIVPLGGEAGIPGGTVDLTVPY